MKMKSQKPSIISLQESHFKEEYAHNLDPYPYPYNRVSVYVINDDSVAAASGIRKFTSANIYIPPNRDINYHDIRNMLNLFHHLC